MTLSVKQKLMDTVLSWPGVTSAPHRFGGTAFLAGGREIGHLHGEHHLDLPFPKPVRDELVASGCARPHHILPKSGWVTVYVHTEQELANAIALLRMKYEQLTLKASKTSKTKP
ncbi:hypothetical protein PRECH8_19770 [Insulibacter thermoxylanivorax]|uniref:Luciferase domain-containing protein n=1 Tax=Insulibacter thermoxylanivorax TaxID=2749268 RepID=A0A916QDE6_9BACL|nr:luciferase family protein [Insulibacter thermoxylanivorax]GFR38681.1 hypothetical protein PRECH8_19770 [Insulibacter thermoxylanivorax]